MKDRLFNWVSRVSRGSFFERATLLIALLGFSFTVVLPFAYYFSAGGGMIASATAMGTCLLAGLLAMSVGELFRGSELMLIGALLGMGIRLTVPLVLFVIFYLRGGMLAEAGLVYYLLVFYPVMLVIETALSLPELDAAPE